MVAAVVIGLIVSVIDVLVLLIIYFLVNNSKISNEEKRRFNKKIFGSEVKEKIRNIVIIVFINLLIEYFIYSLVFFQGPNSWRKYEYESTKIYYSSEKIEISPMTTFVFEEEKEEKQYIVVEYEEKIKLTDKAPLKKLFDFLNIEVKIRKSWVSYNIRILRIRKNKKRIFLEFFSYFLNNIYNSKKLYIIVARWKKIWYNFF